MNSGSNKNKKQIQKEKKKELSKSKNPLKKKTENVKRRFLCSFIAENRCGIFTNSWSAAEW
jgi:hypothetical protein